MTVDPRTVIYLRAILARNGGVWSSTVNRGSFREVRAIVPAPDFDLSKQFYQHLGFELGWSDDSLAYFRHGYSSFFVQNANSSNHADNFVMHLLVVDVEAWWQHVQNEDLKNKYEVKLEPPDSKPWGIRDFVISDPSGVLWRIGQCIR